MVALTRQLHHLGDLGEVSGALLEDLCSAGLPLTFNIGLIFVLRILLSD